MLFTLLKKIDKRVSFTEITQHNSKLPTSCQHEPEQYCATSSHRSTANSHYMLSKINSPEWLL